MITFKNKPALPTLTDSQMKNLKHICKHEVSYSSPMVQELEALGLVGPDPLLRPGMARVLLLGYLTLSAIDCFDECEEEAASDH